MSDSIEDTVRLESEDDKEISLLSQRLEKLTLEYNVKLSQKKMRQLIAQGSKAIRSYIIQLVVSHSCKTMNLDQAFDSFNEGISYGCSVFPHVVNNILCLAAGLGDAGSGSSNLRTSTPPYNFHIVETMHKYMIDNKMNFGESVRSALIRAYTRELNPVASLEQWALLLIAINEKELEKEKEKEKKLKNLSENINNNNNSTTEKNLLQESSQQTGAKLRTYTSLFIGLKDYLEYLLVLLVESIIDNESDEDIEDDVWIWWWHRIQVMYLTFTSLYKATRRAKLALSDREYYILLSATKLFSMFSLGLFNNLYIENILKKYNVKIENLSNILLIIENKFEKNTEMIKKNFQYNKIINNEEFYNYFTWEPAMKKKSLKLINILNDKKNNTKFPIFLIVLLQNEYTEELEFNKLKDHNLDETSKGEEEKDAKEYRINKLNYYIDTLLESKKHEKTEEDLKILNNITEEKLKKNNIELFSLYNFIRNGEKFDKINYEINLLKFNFDSIFNDILINLEKIYNPFLLIELLNLFLLPSPHYNSSSFNENVNKQFFNRLSMKFELDFQSIKNEIQSILHQSNKENYIDNQNHFIEFNFSILDQNILNSIQEKIQNFISKLTKNFNATIKEISINNNELNDNLYKIKLINIDNYTGNLILDNNEDDEEEKKLLDELKLIRMDLTPNETMTLIVHLRAITLLKNLSVNSDGVVSVSLSLNKANNKVKDFIINRAKEFLNINENDLETLNFNNVLEKINKENLTNNFLTTISSSSLLSSSNSLMNANNDFDFLNNKEILSRIDSWIIFEKFLQLKFKFYQELPYENVPLTYEKFKSLNDINRENILILDGANIGYFKQNYSGAPLCVDYFQIDHAARLAKSYGFTPLIILHNRHIRSNLFPIDNVEIRNMVRDWFYNFSENTDDISIKDFNLMINAPISNYPNSIVFLTPKSFNDDWFSLYASLRGGCPILTNDEFRDHHFNFLHTKNFSMWRNRNCIQFETRYIHPNLVSKENSEDNEINENELDNDNFLSNNPSIFTKFSRDTIYLPKFHHNLRKMKFIWPLPFTPNIQYRETNNIEAYFIPPLNIPINMLLNSSNAPIQTSSPNSGVPTFSLNSTYNFNFSWIVLYRKKKLNENINDELNKKNSFDNIDQIIKKNLPKNSKRNFNELSSNNHQDENLKIPKLNE